MDRQIIWLTSYVESLPNNGVKTTCMWMKKFRLKKASPDMLHLPNTPFSPFKSWMHDTWQKNIQGLRFKIKTICLLKKTQILDHLPHIPSSFTHSRLPRISSSSAYISHHSSSHMICLFKKTKPSTFNIHDRCNSIQYSWFHVIKQSIQYN